MNLQHLEPRHLTASIVVHVMHVLPTHETVIAIVEHDPFLRGIRGVSFNVPTPPHFVTPDLPGVVISDTGFTAIQLSELGAGRAIGDGVVDEVARIRGHVEVSEGPQGIYPVPSRRVDVVFETYEVCQPYTT